MQYGTLTPNFGFCGDPLARVDLAREVERAGWDGFFLWDHIRLGSLEPRVDMVVAENIV